MDIGNSVRYLNYVFIAFFSVVTIFKLWLFPSSDLSTAFSIFVTIAYALFMLPYLLSSKVLGNVHKSNKPMIWVMLGWSAFVVIGMVSPGQTMFVILFCAGLLALNVINIVALIKQPFIASA